MYSDTVHAKLVLIHNYYPFDHYCRLIHNYCPFDHYCRVLIQELQAMVDTVGGPNNLRPDDPCNPYPGLTNFSLLSHGFGNHNISSALSVIQSYFNELIGVYEGNKPTAMDSQLPPQQAPGAVYNNGATVIPPAAIYQVGGAGQANVRGKQPSRQKVMKREKKEGLACNGKP